MTADAPRRRCKYCAHKQDEHTTAGCMYTRRDRPGVRCGCTWSAGRAANANPFAVVVRPEPPCPEDGPE